MFRNGTHANTRRALRTSAPAVGLVGRWRARFGDESGDEGFTLIEAIVSFVIFAIVIAAAVTAIVTGIKTSNGNRDRVTAANVAQQALTKAQGATGASLAAAPTATSTSTVGKEPYTVVRRIDYAQASATATAPASSCPTVVTSGTSYWMHIAVTVTWPGANGRTVQMDTVRSC
ncbi:prepilin-type N-terminal cleavage/methylation domain-containing protein [Jatrophihabitans endophyticus]|uniref:type IV pilus modification PilV family protein n=1 Tax=Jatrophihabitans endophyticus TaxID=1206085 RepID=UPI001A06776E|nr:prepilin-type N-terminal cleavage/methylation domain-containing protein [Jatrophihabitans endophyticus]MBE7189289.1 prepilin-type N-terminal cleavage/methylation domain-containing protein [Jatrophihabitans endophyticus]